MNALHRTIRFHFIMAVVSRVLSAAIDAALSDPAFRREITR